MALLQKGVDAAPLSNRPAPDGAQSTGSENTVLDADAQDEALWGTKFAASPDTLDKLAARSQAHRDAGRTKKIGSSLAKSPGLEIQVF